MTQRRSAGHTRTGSRGIQRAAALAAVLLLSFEAGAQPAASGDGAPVKPLAQALTGDARAEYEAGRILFDDGDYANAIIKFERVYELSPSEPRVLWDVALCQWHLRRYSQVITTAERLLTEAGARLSPKQRSDAEALIEATKPYVSRLDLRASEEGATVLVDGRKVDTTPLSKRVLLDVGRREIRVVKPGFKESVIVREVAGGGDTALVVVLEKEIHRGRLSVTAGPNDLITLDGKMVGRGSWEGSVPSGGHTLRVTAPGMLPYQAEVMLKDNQERHVPVRLTPTPPDIGGWLWIGGGAALLAGAIVAGALVFRPEPPIPGNVEPRTVRIAGEGGGLVVRFGAAR